MNGRSSTLNGKMSFQPAPKRRRRLVLPRDAYKELCTSVHQRDGWKCRAPGCGVRQNLHCHHIVFRSHGGDDASYNLITVCMRCHDLIHTRHLVVLPLKDGAMIDADKGVKWMRIP